MKNKAKIYRTVLVMAAEGEKNIKINIKTPENAVKEYKKFLIAGKTCKNEFIKRQFNSLTSGIKRGFGYITDVDSFKEFFESPEVIEYINSNEFSWDRAKISVVLPSFIQICREAEAYYRTYKTKHPDFNTHPYWCTEDNWEDTVKIISEKNDISNYWCCRDAHGENDAKVVFVPCTVFDSTGKPDWDNAKERRFIRALYSHAQKTNYFNARECSFDYWLNNEDIRFSTIR